MIIHSYHNLRRPSRALQVAALAGMLVILTALPLAGAQGLTPHDVARIRTVSEAVISPDGTRIAYLLNVPRKPMVDENGPEWSELHVATAGTSRPFISGSVTISAVGWLPDGKRISFLTRRGTDKRRSLYAIPVEGGEGVKLLEHETDILSYSWSADGKRVAFLAEEALPEKRIKEREQGFIQEIYEEEKRRVRVWVADGPGNPDAKPRVLDLAGSASELHWSPAGARLAVALAPTPLVDDDLMLRRVHVVEADTGKIVSRIDNPGKLGPVAWSPDGRHLSLVSGMDMHDPGTGRLMVVQAGGGVPRDLLPGYEGHVSAIAWQNSKTITFLGDEGVWTIYGRINHDGSGRETIIAAGKTVFTSVSLSRDGKAGAFIGQSPDHPAEAFLMRQGESGARRLTHSNSWLAERALAKQELIQYRARDGLQLEGILIRPLEERAGVRYPLILMVHGGPESHYRNGWLTSYSAPGQVAAARGFAVFYPNYQGSTGRGVEFSQLGQAEPAGKEFDDFVDGVDHLIAAGLVDRDRVGITGGSYGGYASAWGATYYSERFAASVMFVGISNKLSKVGTTDIADEEFLVHARKRPWDDWQLFLERSPIYYAGKSRTPTLILHGKEDTRVHPSQSMELYRHLKLRSKAPVRLVFYPGEGHGNRRSASRLDYNLRMLQWMEHYLKGPGGDPPPIELNYEETKDP